MTTAVPKWKMDRLRFKLLVKTGEKHILFVYSQLPQSTNKHSTFWNDLIRQLQNPKPTKKYKLHYKGDTIGDCYGFKRQ